MIGGAKRCIFLLAKLYLKLVWTSKVFDEHTSDLIWLSCTYSVDVLDSLNDMPLPR